METVFVAVSLVAILLAAIAFDLVAVRYGVDSRRPWDGRRDWWYP